MRLRTFTAPDMPTAMNMVREAMGDDAVILTAEPRNGRRSIRITAAMESGQWAVGSGQKEEEKESKSSHLSLATDHRPLTTDHLRFELQNILRFHNLPELFVAKLMQKASDNDLTAAAALHRVGGRGNVRQLHRLALETLAAKFFKFDPLPLSDRAARLMLVGPPGTGKTLTIAKLAAKIVMDKEPLAVVTTDNKRAGGIEQLKSFTDILGVELKVAADAGELKAHLDNLPKSTRALIDTAGCNPYDRAEMREIEEFSSLSVTPVLAMAAGGDSSEAIDMAEGFAALPVKQLLVTRADTARRFGGVMAAAAAHGLAFSHTSSSSSIIDPLQKMDAGLLAHWLLAYQLQSPST